MRSLSYIESMSLAKSAFAWPSRLGETSVACIDADTSRMATMNRPLSSLPAKYGRVSANTASASRINWMTSSQLCRSFWNGELACVSLRNRCQRTVLETSRATRRRLSR